ncbi:MAG: DNA/RNA non-specific endonuclease [Bacteroidales bacterium]|nr:DNA/RNA non-specific endonuclease [Bacteroidales bacterium]
MSRIARIIPVISLLLTLLVAGCKDDKEDKAEIVIAGEVVAADETEIEVGIRANGTWVLQVSEDWVTPSSTFGDGDMEIRASIMKNPREEERVCKLTLNSGSATATAEIRQAGAEPVSMSSENSNTNEEAMGLEIPRLKEGNYYVQHYAMIEEEYGVNYSIEWNVAMKHAEWVAYTFDAVTSQQNVNRANNWDVDYDLPVEMRVDNTYHTSDGFDRGHLCASADRLYSAQTSDQTFYYSNMSPQLNGFNAGIWERMEEEVRTWARQTQNGKIKKLYVAKGGSLNKLLVNFKGATKGMDGVYPTTDSKGLTVKGLPCPAYYYMAVMKETEQGYTAMAFLVPHDDTIAASGSGGKYTVADIKKYAVSISKLQEEVGVDFFCNLDDEVEQAVESSYDESAWQW